MLSFYHPPDWTAAATPPPDGLAGTWEGLSWHGVLSVAPQGDTAIEITSGTVPGALDVDDTAAFGIQRLVGEEDEAETLCTDSSASIAFLAVDTGTTVAVSVAYIFPNPIAGQTAFVTYTMAGPTRDFAALTDQVFVPVFYQFYRNGGTDPDGLGGGGGDDDGDGGGGEDDGGGGDDDGGGGDDDGEG